MDKILLFILIVGIIVTVAEVQIGDDCSAPNAAKCDEITNAECSANTCKCVAGYYGATATTVCTLVQIGDDCSAPNAAKCDEITHAECNSANTCKCVAGYYGATTTACTKVRIDDDCSAPNAAKCDQIPNAECNSVNKCRCKDGYYGGKQTTVCYSLDPANCKPAKGCVCRKTLYLCGPDEIENGPCFGGKCAHLSTCSDPGLRHQCCPIKPGGTIPEEKDVAGCEAAEGCVCRIIRHACDGYNMIEKGRCVGGRSPSNMLCDKPHYITQCCVRSRTPGNE